MVSSSLPRLRPTQVPAATKEDEGNEGERVRDLDGGGHQRGFLVLAFLAAVDCAVPVPCRVDAFLLLSQVAKSK